MNDKNLIPFSNRSESEARENGRKGGIKSGEVRRRKKSMRTAMKELLSLDVADVNVKGVLESLGVTPDNQNALLMAVLVKGIRNGDPNILKAVASISGEDNDTERVKLQKKQVALQEKKLSGEEEQTPDDGFLSALDGSAAEDWNGED